MSVYPREKAGELLGVVVLAFSLLLILSLATYSGLDPAANVSSPSHDYANYVGKVGAWSSDFLFHILGLSALYLPLLFLVIGYKKLRSRRLEYPFTKLFGFVCTLAALSAGLTLMPPALPDSVNFTSGGLLGILIANFLLIYLNSPGSLVVVSTVLVLSLIVTTRFSLDRTFNWLQGRNWNLFSAMTGHYGEWQRRREQKEKLARLSQEKRRLVTQTAPRKVFQEEPLGVPQEKIEDERPQVTVTLPPDSIPATASPQKEQSSQKVFSPLRGAQIIHPYQIPPLDFLQPSADESAIDEQELIQRARILATKCAEFDVHGRVLQIHPGPVVTTFEFKPEAGVKYSKITNLADDLCLALRAETIRIDRIPGKNTVGIEVPNVHRQTIHLREILEGAAFQQSPSRLTLALGKLINGNTYVSDLTRMPHLLIAGATGSGKSVALNCMVCSILYKSSPADIRFIMIDPKRLELGVYEDIPHLLTPIVTDPRQASNALNWAVVEMEHRYKLLAQEGVRNSKQYNQLIREGAVGFEERDPLPYIVLVVDELAELMMTAGKEVEAALTRLAQMARAVGLHLILATQRPSVDVLTGLIKANFPCRISFRVSSRVDSRTILDSNGAERLLGAGDMLFLPPGTSRLIRIHGPFISEKEIHQITDFLKKQAEPEYQEEVLAGQPEGTDDTLVEVSRLEDVLYDEASRFVVETGRASTSLLQRRLRIGYGRAARLLDMMENEGLIGPPDGSKPRAVLVSADYFDQIKDE
ncbi:DNA translocase FtsK [Acidobacteria bacterium AH-259-D05]|nr:DNA translocase FtsK [Acidobacteria bacterium AH-259-D05]